MNFRFAILYRCNDSVMAAVILCVIYGIYGLLR